jgi:hypothetical protein
MTLDRPGRQKSLARVKPGASRIGRRVRHLVASPDKQIAQDLPVIFVILDDEDPVTHLRAAVVRPWRES